MQHTSIRLTDEHAARIKKTGKGPSTVIKEALEAYFNPPPDISELVREHERRYHVPQNEHKESTPVPHIEHISGTSVRECEHNGGTPQPTELDNLECKKEGEAIICAARPELTTEGRQALEFILEELQAGKEPTSREAAEHVGLTPTGLGMALAKHGIKAQNTRREMKSVKIYTKPMKARIREILGQQ